MAVSRAVEFAHGPGGILSAQLVQDLQIAAAAEYGGMRGLHHDPIYLWRWSPALVVFAEGGEHFARQRVQPVRPVQGDNPGPVVLFEGDA